MTATDWLHLLVREEGLNSEVKHAALNALDFIAAKSDESWLSATAHLVITFRTTRINPDHPHASEITLFWRYVSEHDLKEPIERKARLLVPSELERYVVEATTSLFVMEASDNLCTSPVEPQSPMGYNMRMRETATRELFNRYATMLSARNLSKNERQHIPLTHVAAVNNQPISRDSLSDHASEVAEFRYLLLDARESFYRLTRCNPPSPTGTTQKHLGVAPPRYDAAYQLAPPSLAAIKNQAATTPGKHGVSFLHRELKDDQRNKRNTRDEACPPGAAPPSPYPASSGNRREISSFIRANKMRFHATPLVFHVCHPLLARVTTS